MKMISAVIRVLFVATAVVTAALLFPPGNAAVGQDDDDNVICIGTRCVYTNALHRCDFAPDPCGCLFCEFAEETCCYELEPVVVKGERN